MLLMALAKLQKLVNWVQVVFNNLHSRLWDLFAIIKPKKKPMGMSFMCSYTYDLAIRMRGTHVISNFEQKNP